MWREKKEEKKHGKNVKRKAKKKNYHQIKAHKKKDFKSLRAIGKFPLNISTSCGGPICTLYFYT